jgi:hypothetical protein
LIFLPSLFPSSTFSLLAPLTPPLSPPFLPPLRSPHYENGLKYAVALSVSMWGAYQPKHRKDGLWQLCLLLATLYQAYWDIFVDWDMLHWYVEIYVYRYICIYRGMYIYV